MNNNFSIGDFVILSPDIRDEFVKLMERPITIDSYDKENRILGRFGSYDLAMVVNVHRPSGQIELRGHNVIGWTFSMFFKKV